MDISSLTAVTSSSTQNTGSGAPASASATPFADVMQRASADKAKQQDSAKSDPVSATNLGDTKATTQDAIDTISRTTPDSRREFEGDVETGDWAPPSLDARQMLQALASGDTAGLHRQLAALADDGETPTTDATGDDDETLSDVFGNDDTLPGAANLAAMVAAVSPAAVPPTAMTPQNASSTLGAGASGTLGAGQNPMSSMMIAATVGPRPPMGEAPATAADGREAPGLSTRVNASTFQSSALAATSGGGLTSAAASTASDGALLTAPGSGAAMSGTSADAGAGIRLEPTDLEGLDIATSSGSRADPGALSSLTASLSTHTGLATPPAAAATPTNSTIAASIQSPQWPASFGQQVLHMHQRGDRQMSLRLHPQELGPLSVSLTVQDQQAQLQIVSAHAPVRAAVEAAMPQLRQALADSGIALGEAMVGDQGMFQQGQSRQDGGFNDDGSRRAVSGVLASGSIDTNPADAASLGRGELTARHVALAGHGNINLYA